MISFAIPGDLDAPTGGYAYARRIMAEWARAGIAHRVIKLPGGFPIPTPPQMNAAHMALGLADAPLLIDGLAYGAFNRTVARAVGPRATVLVHHPLCDETGLSQDAADTAFERERVALAEARHIVVTSPLTARDLTARFGVEATRLTVAEPGLNIASPAPLAGNPPQLLAIGSVTPRKGYSYLVEALALCTDLPWQCRIIGAADRDTGEAAKIADLIARHALADRITLEGAVPPDAIPHAYASADLLVAPSLHEGYGMAVAEAMAHGLPVITTTAGALPETAPTATLIAPGSTPPLADALRALLSDAAARASQGAANHAHARTRPGWPDTARRVARAMGITETS